MADKKISELTALLANQAASNDLLVVVDIGDSTTKKMTLSEAVTYFTTLGNLITSSDIGVDVQAYSANLSEYAAVNPTTAGLALLDDVDAAAQRSTLGLVIGTNVQAYDAGLQSISGLTTAADNMIYTTAIDTYAVTSLTAAGRALLDDADAAAQRTTLGLGTAATQNLTAFATAAQGALADTAQQESYAARANGTTALALATDNVVKVTPTATATFTTTVPAAGTRCSVIILTSGTTSYTMTFGTGFRSTGTLATGTVTARLFVVDFISDGTNLLETGRTAAYAA